LDIGVVIAGAGARGAYEAGLLAHLLPEIAFRVQEIGKVARFSFLGTSAGSLNSVLIASRAPEVKPDDPAQAARDRWTETMSAVTDIWGRIGEGDVIGPRPSGRLLGALTRPLPWHLPLISVLNVDALIKLANKPDVVNWDNLHDRVERGIVPTVGAAVTARDGRTVVFLHRHDRLGSLSAQSNLETRYFDGNRDRYFVDASRDIYYVDTNGLVAEHVLASSAIPAAFPAQPITQPARWAGWYYDGGVRLNTPLKPALELGLKHLVIVGTHPDRYVRDDLPGLKSAAPEIDESCIPVANQLMADQLVQDLITMRSRNRITTDPNQKIRYIFAGPPSFDTLAELSRERASQVSATRVLRRLLAGPARWELSSYLLFDRGYLSGSVTAGRARAAQPEVLKPGPDFWRTDQ
jgi:NTE family protein